MPDAIAYRWIIRDTRPDTHPDEQAILAVAEEGDTPAGFRRFRDQMFPECPIIDLATGEALMTAHTINDLTMLRSQVDTTIRQLWPLLDALGEAPAIEAALEHLLAYECLLTQMTRQALTPEEPHL